MGKSLKKPKKRLERSIKEEVDVWAIRKSVSR